jgi:hypothetical protein
MKKVRGENDIEAALQRLDRLTQDEGLATGAQTLQVVNKVERESFPICIVLRRPGALSRFAGDNVVRNIREWLFTSRSLEKPQHRS